MDTRELFKKLVYESLHRGDEYVSRKGWTVLGKHGSTISNWFSWFGTNKSTRGKYAHLTDEYIDSHPIENLTDQMILFIADHFKQR